MPNRLFQSIINQMRDATDRIIGVVDDTGTVISCSELGLIGESRKGVVAAGVFSGAQVCVDTCTYKAFGDDVHPEYACFVDGTDETSRRYVSIIAVALDQIKKNNDEAKQPNLQTWANDFRKLVELDGKSIENVETVIKWSQQDKFWKSNVLSAKKVREKYDTLKIQSGKFDKNRKGTTGGGNYGGIVY